MPTGFCPCCYQDRAPALFQCRWHIFPFYLPHLHLIKGPILRRTEHPQLSRCCWCSALWVSSSKGGRAPLWRSLSAHSEGISWVWDPAPIGSVPWVAGQAVKASGWTISLGPGLRAAWGWEPGFQTPSLTRSSWPPPFAGQPVAAPASAPRSEDASRQHQSVQLRVTVQDARTGSDLGAGISGLAPDPSCYRPLWKGALPSWAHGGLSSPGRKRWIEALEQEDFPSRRCTGLISEQQD